MRKKIGVIAVVVLIIGAIGCIYTTYFYGYHGRVIDADTNASIEGAVVVASWREERPTIAGPTSRLKDVKETLTDKNGQWSLRGARGEKLGPSTLLSYVTSFFTGFMWGTYTTQRPEFIVFKPGYCSWPKGFGIDACKEKIKLSDSNKVWEGATLELPRLTNREERSRSLPSPFHIDGDGGFYIKQGSFIRLINEENRNLGIEEYGTLKRYEK
jgi:hypothetical protein